MGDSQYSSLTTTPPPLARRGNWCRSSTRSRRSAPARPPSASSCANGVAIATEKKLPLILVDEISIGMGPDFHVLVRKSGKQAQQYYRLYKETIPVTQLVRETAAVTQEFTQSGRYKTIRLLIVGYDDNAPPVVPGRLIRIVLFVESISYGKKVCPMQRHFLKRGYTEDMELDDAVHTAILTLKEGFEGQISSNNIEIGISRSDREFKVLSPAEIKDFLEEVE
ncbi:hypothetical protein ACP4OV_012579 [Aristida adscensionis]